MVKNLPADVRDELLIPGSEGMVPWRRAWQPTPVFFPGEPQGQEPSQLHRLAKRQTQLK